MLSWALYLILPRWKFTPVLALIAPVIHSCLYAGVLTHMIKYPTPGIQVDFSSLEGIMPGFALPDGAFAGWLHYCAFDPLVCLAIVLDAKRLRVPHLLCADLQRGELLLELGAVGRDGALPELVVHVAPRLRVAEQRVLLGGLRVASDERRVSVTSLTRATRANRCSGDTQATQATRVRERRQE